ncbi:unnamed protein product [Linum trigynum]|uniref:Uncharacterized protein n=1 Tax=Linum trigynum TaxID=586398 RepID=A0AAV2DH28_9ROSI
MQTPIIYVQERFHLSSSKIPFNRLSSPEMINAVPPQRLHADAAEAEVAVVASAAAAGVEEQRWEPALDVL